VYQSIQPPKETAQRKKHRFQKCGTLQAARETSDSIIENIAVLIPGILVVPGLKCKWSVNEIEIQILEPESL
jgi:hypothetical protein